MSHDNKEAMSVSIPRQYLPRGNTTKQHSKLHIVADASPIAYGAIALICMDGNTSFVMAKVRVAFCI